MFGTWLLLHPSALVGHESVPKAQAVATHSPPTQNLDQPAKQIVIFQRLSMKLCPENGCEKSWDLFSLHFFASNMDSDQFRPLASHLVQRSESRRCKGSSPLASPLRLIQRDVKSESPKRQSNLSPMTLSFCGQMICPYLFWFQSLLEHSYSWPNEYGNRRSTHSPLSPSCWYMRQENLSRVHLFVAKPYIRLNGWPWAGNWNGAWGAQGKSFWPMSVIGSSNP